MPATMLSEITNTQTAPLLPPPVLRPRPQPYARSMFRDINSWENGLTEQQRRAFRTQRDMYPDPVIGNQEISVAQWLIESHPNLDSSTVLRNRRTLMAGIAASNGWDDAKTNTQAFYNRIAAEMKFADAQQRLVAGVEPNDKASADEKLKVWTESLNQQAYMAAAAIEDTDDPSTADTASLAGYTAWSQSVQGKDGIRPENVRLYVDQWDKSFAEGLADKKKAVEAARSAYPIIASSADAWGADPEKALTFFRPLTGQQKQLALKYLDVINRDQTGIVEGMSGGKQALVAFNRTLLNMFRNFSDTAEQQSYDGLTFTEGQEVDARYVTSPEMIVNAEMAERMLASTSSEGQNPFAEPPPQVRLTKAQADAANKVVEEKLEHYSLKAELADIAQGKLDPLRRETLWQKASLGAAESLAAMMMTVTPFGAPIRYESYRYDAYNKLIQSGQSRENARVLAPAIGAAQFGLDYASLAFLKRVPGVSTIFNKAANLLGGGLAARFAGRAASTLVGETAVELTQDILTEAIVTDVYSFLTGNIPGTNWSKVKDNIWNATPDTLAAMLLLAPVGAGMAHISDVKQFDSVVRNPAALRLLQYNENTISLIMSAPEGVAQTIFKDEWQNRGVADQTPGMSPYDAYEWLQKPAAEKLAEVTAAREDEDTQPGDDANRASALTPTDVKEGPGIAPGNVVTPDAEALIAARDQQAEAALNAFVQQETNTLTGNLSHATEEAWNTAAGVSQFYRDGNTWHLRTNDGKILDGGDVNTAHQLRERLAVENMKQEAKELETTAPKEIPTPATVTVDGVELTQTPKTEANEIENQEGQVTLNEAQLLAEQESQKEAEALAAEQESARVTEARKAVIDLKYQEGWLQTLLKCLSEAA